MSRSTRRRTIRAVAPVAGLLAAGLLVWQGSYAAFNATTVNTANSWTTGNLVLTNNGGTAAYAASTAGVFAQAGMKIGDTGTKCLTVNSGGSLAGDLRVYRGAISGANNALLAPQIALTVTAVNLGGPGLNVDNTCAGFPGGASTVYTGALSAMPVTYAASTGFAVPANAQRIAYKFVWTLNTTGTTAGDNALQSSNATADLNWEIQ